MKIAYCGYDFFSSSLEGLIKDGHELSELFTWKTDNEYDFNDKVISTALSQNARITISPISKDDLLRLKKNEVDVLISAAYPYKIPEWRSFVRYAVNIHPSLLPIGRGPWPLPWLILKGYTRTGVSIHEISDIWDGGDVICQKEFSMSDHETLESLSIRSQILAKSMVVDLLNNFESYWSNKWNQPKSEYWKMPSKSDRTIDFTMSVTDIDKIVRAFSKFEPFLYLGSTRYFVRGIDFWEENHNYQPGEIVHESSREVVYAASDGFVILSNYVKAASDEAEI